MPATSAAGEKRWGKFPADAGERGEEWRQKPKREEEPPCVARKRTKKGGGKPPARPEKGGKKTSAGGQREAVGSWWPGERVHRRERNRGIGPPNRGPNVKGVPLLPKGGFPVKVSP